MHVYSRWAIATASPEQVDAIATQIGGDTHKPVEDDTGGRVWERYRSVDQSVDTRWEQSRSSSVLWSGFADIPIWGDGRLVGTLASTQALAESLGNEAVDLMLASGMKPVTVSFSLVPLIDKAIGVSAISIRYRNEYGEIVLMSETAEQLLGQLHKVGPFGKPIGLTVATGDNLVTAYGDDTLVFTDPQTAIDLITLIRTIEFAVELSREGTDDAQHQRRPNRRSSAEG